MHLRQQTSEESGSEKTLGNITGPTGVATKFTLAATRMMTTAAGAEEKTAQLVQLI